MDQNKDSLWPQGTRRNTRSSSNQDKEAKEKAGATQQEENRKEQREDFKKRDSCSSGHIIRGSHNEVVEYKTDDGDSYKLFDSAYISTDRSDNPYFIGTIQEIKVSKKDNAVVVVKWYYRPGEVPDSVYQMLVKERLDGADDPKEKELIINNECRNRELFVSDEDNTDIFPVSRLRGKCTVAHFNDFHAVKDYDLKPDSFFYILGYNPEKRRLTSTHGEIRVGPSHQWNASTRGIFQKAVVPDLMPPLSPAANKVNTEYEELIWEPKTNDCDLIMYLHSARSLAAFAGMCDGGSTEEGCIIASRDETTINALNVLFQNGGDTRAALQVVVKNPVPLTIERKWTEDQVKRFQKGLRQNGKNFFKIKRDLLPGKETSELVEFYYLWKKVQENLVVQPQSSKNRRQASIKRNSKQSTPSTEAGGEGSSSDILSDSEESDKDNANFRCKHCCTTTSDDWNLGGKEGVMLCTKCRIFFKKYGGATQVDIDFDNDTPSDVEDVDRDTPTLIQPPPFMFKPIKDKLTEEHHPVSQNMECEERNDNIDQPDFKPSKRQLEEATENPSSPDEKAVEEKRVKVQSQDKDGVAGLSSQHLKLANPSHWVPAGSPPVSVKKEPHHPALLPISQSLPTNGSRIPPTYSSFTQYPPKPTAAASQAVDHPTANVTATPPKEAPRPPGDRQPSIQESRGTVFYPVAHHHPVHPPVNPSYPGEGSKVNPIYPTDGSKKSVEGDKPDKQRYTSHAMTSAKDPNAPRSSDLLQAKPDAYHHTHPHPHHHHHHRPHPSKPPADQKVQSKDQAPADQVTKQPNNLSRDDAGPRRNPTLRNPQTHKADAEEPASDDEPAPDVQPHHHVTIPAGQLCPPHFRLFVDGLAPRSRKPHAEVTHKKLRFMSYSSRLCSRTDLAYAPLPDARTKSDHKQHSSQTAGSSSGPSSAPRQHTPHQVRTASTDKERDGPKKSRDDRTPAASESTGVKREPTRLPSHVPKTTPVHGIPQHRSTPTHLNAYNQHRSAGGTASQSSPYAFDSASHTLMQYASIDREASKNMMAAPGQTLLPYYAQQQQSERDLRERELRERELRERMPKQAFDSKFLEAIDSQSFAQAMALQNFPPGLVPHLINHPTLDQAHHPQIPGILLGGPSTSSQVPGPFSLVSHPELQLQQNMADRIANERMHAERAALEQYQREILQSHQHSHVHSHLHLHPSNIPGAPPTPAVIPQMPPTDPALTMMALQAQAQAQTQQAMAAAAAGMDPLHAASMTSHPMLNLGGIRAPHVGGVFPSGLQLHPGLPPRPDSLQQYISATQHLQAVAHEQSLMDQRLIHEEFMRSLAHKP